MSEPPAAKTNKTCVRIGMGNIFVDLRGLPSAVARDAPRPKNVSLKGMSDWKAEEFRAESRLGRIVVSDPTSLTGCGNPYKLVGTKRLGQATAAGRLDRPIR